MINVVERYAGLNLGIPPISEVAHRVILNSYGNNSQKILLGLAKSKPEEFDKLVIDSLNVRKNEGHDVDQELAIHRSWNHRRLLNLFLDSDSTDEHERRFCTSINIIDDEHAPWSKVEGYFRERAAVILSEFACSDLVQIEIPKIGKTIQQQIGNILVTNSLILNPEQIPFSSAYTFAKV